MGQLWIGLFTLPLKTAIQEACGRIVKARVRQRKAFSKAASLWTSIVTIAPVPTASQKLAT
jgi:hypothetical protein